MNNILKIGLLSIVCSNFLFANYDNNIINNTNYVVKEKNHLLDNKINIINNYVNNYLLKNPVLNVNKNTIKNYYGLDDNFFKLGNINLDLKLDNNYLVIKNIAKNTDYKDYLSKKYFIQGNDLYLPLNQEMTKYVSLINTLNSQGFTVNSKDYKIKGNNDYTISLISKNGNNIGDISLNKTSNFIITDKSKLNKLPKINNLTVKVKNYDKTTNYIYNNGQWEEIKLYDGRFNGNATIYELTSKLWDAQVDSIAHVKNIDPLWNGYIDFYKVLYDNTDINIWQTKDKKFFIVKDWNFVTKWQSFFNIGNIIYFHTQDNKVLKAKKTNLPDGKIGMIIYFTSYQEAAQTLKNFPITSTKYVLVNNDYYKIVKNGNKTNLISLKQNYYVGNDNGKIYQYYTILTYNRSLLNTILPNKDKSVILSYEYDCNSNTCNLNNKYKAKKWNNLYLFYYMPYSKTMKNKTINNVSDSIYVDGYIGTDDFDDRAAELYSDFNPAFAYSDLKRNIYIPLLDSKKEYKVCAYTTDKTNLTLKTNGTSSIDDWIGVFQFYDENYGHNKFKKWYLNFQHSGTHFPTYRGQHLSMYYNNGRYNFNRNIPIIGKNYKSVVLIEGGNDSRLRNRYSLPRGNGGSGGYNTSLYYINSKRQLKRIFDPNNYMAYYRGMNVGYIMALILPSPSNYELKFYYNYNCSGYLGNKKISRKTLLPIIGQNAYRLDINSLLKRNSSYRIGCIQVINQDKKNEKYNVELPLYFVKAKYGYYGTSRYFNRDINHLNLLVMKYDTCYLVNTQKTYGINLIWKTK